MDFNQLLESVNQNISEAVFRSDKDGLIYVNSAFVKMFGYTSEKEVRTLAISSLYKDPRERTRLINKLNADHSYENEEVVFLRKDNTEFVGLISTIMHTDKNGNVFWDGAIRDVTREREFLDRIRSREQLLESINKNINEAIYRSENKKGIIYVNDEFVRMFGYNSGQEIMDMDPMELYKDPNERAAIGEEILKLGSIENKEVQFRRKDGSTFWGYLNSIMIEGVDGKIYFDGAVRNITKEKEAEQALMKYAEMQRILINLSTKYIDLPLEEVEQAINDSLKELGEFVGADRSYVFDFDKEGGVCSNTFEWCANGISPEIHNNQNLPLDIMPELVNAHLKGDPMIVDDVRKLKKKDFKELLEAQSIRSLITMPMIHNKECVGFVGFDWTRKYHKAVEKEVLLLELFSEMLVNIRIRSHNERELHKLFSKTIEQNQRLKDFSYITSHNFRSSVANLVGLLTIIEDDPGNKEYFEMLKSTALKLNLAIDAINDLLNFEKDISMLEKEEINLLDVVNDVILLNRKSATEKNIELIVDIPKTLTLRILPAYLQSILHNLITNAMKYGVTEDQRKIKISAKKESKEVFLTVADQGRGIDLERYGGKMFQLGSRFHPDEESGHGMGLYMTKQQVEAINGRIEVESEINKGTTFKVYFNG
ncbi:PAS domain S-box-containing protein [Ekhidna lutea]|uniref:histidine kinase n=1 Tax=Ekhidna lutea TaxID=447679 RepID=A0A239FLR9_EKHLU|nr:PAS domain S-box protein [Ekhidna lutea]SNS57815.1 PAS domain S-box-containing protein [Ekhidna lutea]